MKSKSENYETGMLGEQLSCDYLEKNGFILNERNYKGLHGEIDIIAKDGSYTVFIEVKTRTESLFLQKYGRPSASVDRLKKTRFIDTVMEYQRKNSDCHRCRIDVIEVLIPKNKTDLASVKIKHIKSAFGAESYDRKLL